MHPVTPIFRIRFFAMCVVGLMMTTQAQAVINPDQVLVVFNSKSAEGIALKDAYLAAHPGIPPENVVDLDNNFLNGNPEIIYTNFINLVRNPIRDHINLPGPPEAADIISIVLIRPIPHRINDTDSVNAGDTPAQAAFEFLPPANGGDGDATYCSVDAELALLWQELDAGEAGSTMDSLSDNVIDNPYHRSGSQINVFFRGNIQTPKTFINSANVCWLVGGAGANRLTPGDMYLVARIDGTTQADALALIERAADPYANKAAVRILFDEYDVANNELDDDGLFSTGDPFNSGDDFEETTNILQANGWDVRYDGTFDFIHGTDEPLPLIAYSSYGENHDQNGFGENPIGEGVYIDDFNFPPGAIFNTAESYNGRAFNGQTTVLGQEQIADFVTAGGTFAVGHVWEPFTFTLADNEYLFVRMLLNGFQWGEAAYAALPVLSWQHVVLGDPLARIDVIDDDGLPLGDMDGNGVVNGIDIQLFTDVALNGIADYRATFPTLDPILRGDFTGDYRVMSDDVPGFTAALTGP